jgi:hypothetical protein
MSTLSSFKLVAAKRPIELSPVVQRRNRLIAKIWEQTELAKAQQNGQTFAPMHFRKIKDAETGICRRIETPKRIKPWWFTSESGKLCLLVRYGAKSLELAKGKTAIEIATHADLIPTLDMLKIAVGAGELDAQIELISGTLRSGFIKK